MKVSSFNSRCIHRSIYMKNFIYRSIYFDIAKYMIPYFDHICFHISGVIRPLHISVNISSLRFLIILISRKSKNQILDKNQDQIAFLYCEALLGSIRFDFGILAGGSSLIHHLNCSKSPVFHHENLIWPVYL